MTPNDILIDRQLAVLDNTYLFYSEDPSRRGVDVHGTCYYVKKTGGGIKRCSVGRCMLPGLTNSLGDARTVDGKHLDAGQPAGAGLDKLLQKQFRGMGLAFWYNMQEWHDDKFTWKETRRMYKAYCTLRDGIVKGLYCPPKD